jgi:hypothetical protein
MLDRWGGGSALHFIYSAGAGSIAILGAAPLATRPVETRLSRRAFFNRRLGCGRLSFATPPQRANCGLHLKGSAGALWIVIRLIVGGNDQLSRIG